MIFIDRDRDDQDGQKISPDAAWFASAQTATTDAVNDPDNHDFDDGIYAADIVRAALEKLFHHKCAYCEWALSESFDVEHFRPKGRIAENDEHPGYYWLAYTWTNLLPSCLNCNRRRRDKPIWDDLSEGVTGGKFDHFPLVDESNRAMNPNDDVVAEDALILNPCVDDPEVSIVYLVDGDIKGIDKYGESTIKICNLKRRRLRKRRRERIISAIEAISIIKDLKNEDKVEEVAKLKKFFDENFLADKCQFAAAARCLVKRPENFGIS